MLTQSAALRATALNFDPRSVPETFYDNPYPIYHALREHAPIHRVADGSFFLTRHAHLVSVYRHQYMSSDKRVEFTPKFGDGPLYGHHTTSMVFRDAPSHTRLRRLVAPFFTPKALAAVEPRIVDLIDKLTQRFIDRGSMDLVSDFAFALPVEVVCDLLGVPKSEREPLRNWSRSILGALEPATSTEMINEGNAAVSAFSSFLRELIAQKRRNRNKDSADVLAQLVHAVDGDTLSEYELIQNCIFILNAGHETTTNLIANGINALLEHPAELARLREQPQLIDTAIEEFLRYESSNQLGNRRALRPVTIGDVVIPENTSVTLCIGAANRDPEVFDDPDRLNIARRPNRHLAFAQGAHACAGMSLARLEARIAIGHLVARCPNLRAAAPPVRAQRMRFRVVTSLEIEC